MTISTTALFHRAEKLISARSNLSPTEKADINFKNAQARLMHATAAKMESELEPEPPRLAIFPSSKSELHNALEAHETDLVRMLSTQKYRDNLYIKQRLADVREASMQINLAGDVEYCFDVWEY